VRYQVRGLLDHVVLVWLQRLLAHRGVDGFVRVMDARAHARQFFEHSESVERNSDRRVPAFVRDDDSAGAQLGRRIHHAAGHVPVGF
jgi:hypothetical protein